LHLTTAVVDGRRDRRSQPATVAGGRARRGTRRRSPTAWRQGAPEHTLSPPVPIVATIRWAVDGEEHIDTEALGWTGQAVYVRVPDPRCRTNAIWLDGVDVQRR
jgi:hypothetical protein